MSSNFQFLQKGWPQFFSSAIEAEVLALNVPRSSVFEARYTMEQVINWLYNNDDYLDRPYRDNLASLIHEQTFKDNLAPGLFGSIRFIWETGNHAAHKAQQEKLIDSKLSIICLKHLHSFLSWFYKCYSENTSIPMDTGIDVPETLNLVFFKIVRSKSKFWQMIGRGTRLCEDLFAPGEDKKFFTIFDFCENFEFFEQNPNGYVALKLESLTARIFLSRLKLSQIIKNPELQEDERYKSYYSVLIDLLHAEVREIKDDRGETILVRAHRRYIDKYYKKEIWKNLFKTDLHDIEEHIAHLTIPHDNDELARRFDLLILNLQIAIIENEPLQNNRVKDVREIARYLYEKKLSIPSVAKQKNLLLELTSDEYWESLHISSLEELRISLRDLIKFIERNTRNPVFTYFEDSFGEVKESPEIHPSMGDLTNYRRKVEKYIQENKDYLVIHKLIFNDKITTYDIHQLEHFLFHGDIGTKEDFQEAYPEEKSLGRFIRSIVGLDRNEAKKSFSRYLDENNFSANQITFINQIIDFLTQKGVLEPSQLFEIPFDEIHTEGISGIFNDNDTRNIIDIIEGINLNSEVVV